MGEASSARISPVLRVGIMVALLSLLLLATGCSILPESPSASTGTSAPPYATTTKATTTSTAPTTSTSVATTTSTTISLPDDGKELVVLPTEEKVIALTFDAAYDPEPLPGILAALKEAGAKGTFFLTGEFVRDFPDSVKAIKAAGHAIGNHSYSHPDFLTVSDDEIRSQLRRTADALTALGIADPRPLFRFPYGSRNAAALRLVAGEGYLSYFWTIDTLDWKEDRTPEQVRETVLNKLRPGAIVLMHVGSRQTESVLPQVLKDLAEREYRTVGLREALAAYGL